MSARGRRALPADPHAVLYRWLWQPLLLVQLVLCLRATAAEIASSAPLSRSLYLAPVLTWIAATLLQRHLAARMLAASQQKGTAGELAFAQVRQVHRAVGWVVCVVGLVGLAGGALLALSHRELPLLAAYLLLLPLMLMVPLSARDRTRSLATHRFWTEAAFLGPAIASVGGSVAGVGGAVAGWLAVVGPAWWAWSAGERPHPPRDPRPPQLP